MSIKKEKFNELNISKLDRMVMKYKQIEDEDKQQLLLKLIFKELDFSIRTLLCEIADDVNIDSDILRQFKMKQYEFAKYFLKFSIDTWNPYTTISVTFESWYLGYLENKSIKYLIQLQDFD